VALGRAAGLELYEIDRGELRRRLPYMAVDDVVAACLCPSDGYLAPPELARLYLEVARRNGVELRPHTSVERILLAGGRVTGCVAGGETYAAPVVVNAGGPWSYLVADLAGQPLPTAGVRHCYFTVGPDPAHPVDPDSPTARDRENQIYSRPTREGALHVGIYEAEPVVCRMEAFPAGFRMAAMRTSEDDPAIQALLAAARRRFPLVASAAPRRITTGIMAWTPDGNALCGELPGRQGLYHCAGFCGHGVMQSAAVGLLMAELILDGRCRYDLAELEADRFFDLPEFADRARVEARCADAYASCYRRIEAKASAA
jgi:glycine/D-amino acid oxidase-like deaminating enzyme